MGYAQPTATPMASTPMRMHHRSKWTAASATRATLSLESAAIQVLEVMKVASSDVHFDDLCEGLLAGVDVITARRTKFQGDDGPEQL
jgi:hypothetical protein